MRKHLILIILICIVSFDAMAQSEADLATMRTRLFNSVYGASFFDLSKQNTDGTFNTVVYPAIYPTDFTGEPRSHLNEMYVLASSYNTPGNQYKSQALMDAYVKAWNWWYTTNPIDANWWYRSIGFPNSLFPSFLLIADDLKTYNPEAFNTLSTYLLAEWTPQFYAESMASPDGANTSDVAYYTFATAVTAGVDSIAAQTAEVLTNLIDIQTTPKGEGIHPDYSFSAHTGTGRQLYLGNYGKEYMGGIIRFMIMTDDTYLEVAAGRVTIFENLFLEGASWVAYRNIFDHHQHGRRVMPTDGYVKTLSCMNSLIQLNTPQKAKLQEVYNWMSRSFEDSETNIQQGNRMFWRHDYMVHKGKNYFTSNRMSSTRVFCSESGNGEGLTNYYTGSGINYIYITGQEYLEFWDDINWRRLPGLTAPQKATSVVLPDVGPTRARGLNGDSFAGGTSDGITGVTGFKYNKVHSTEVNVTANKSVFYFEDYFVVLGSDVKAGKTYGVPFATTVNQVKYKDNFVVDNNGATQRMTIDQAIAPETSNWAFLNNIGYQFLTNTKLNFEVKTVGATPVAWMAFNHGNQPVDDKYAYAVFPNITQEEFNNRLNEKRVEVVANSATVQCVVDTIADLTQAVFYLPGTINLPGEVSYLTVIAPIVVQMKHREDSLYLNVANPYCETRNISLTIVTLGGLYEGEGAVMDVENNKTTVTIPMPLDEFQGSTVTVGLKKKVVSGIQLVSRNASVLNIYPNVMNAGTQCSFTITDKNTNPSKITLYNSSGSIIREIVSTPDSSNRIWIDTKGLSQNIYFVKYGSLTGKIIIK